MSELFSATWRALTERDPWKKCELVSALSREWQRGSLEFDPDIALPDVAVAGHPDRPELVNPRDLPQRGLGSIEGRAALIHAVTHIEFKRHQSGP